MHLLVQIINYTKCTVQTQRQWLHCLRSTSSYAVPPNRHKLRKKLVRQFHTEGTANVRFNIKLAQMTSRLGYGLNDRRFEVRFRTGARECVWIGCGTTQPTVQRVWVRFPLIAERPGPEADHSPSFSTDVNKVCSYTSNDLCVFLEWCNAVLAGTNLPLPLPLKFWRQHFATTCTWLGLLASIISSLNHWDE